MKTLIVPIALLAAACLPAAAHHESATYGIFWKQGAPMAIRPAGKSAAQDIWRFAFISKYTWKGCEKASSY